MKRSARKTTPKVVDGKVQRKNRSAETPNYYNTPQDVPVIDRQKSGHGYRHLIKKRELVDFISILPDWEELSRGLNAVVLASGEFNVDGWYGSGVVGICAWDRVLARELDPSYYAEHRDLFARLGVPCRKTGGVWSCEFNEATARAYQLVHVFLHELGHHHDRMTTKSKGRANRGEDYAENYAIQYEKVIWNRYQEVFGLV